jgi:hypothetical protein
LSAAARGTEPSCYLCFASVTNRSSGYPNGWNCSGDCCLAPSTSGRCSGFRCSPFRRSVFQCSECYCSESRCSEFQCSAQWSRNCCLDARWFDDCCFYGCCSGGCRFERRCACCRRNSICRCDLQPFSPWLESPTSECRKQDAKSAPTRGAARVKHCTARSCSK